MASGIVSRFTLVDARPVREYPVAVASEYDPVGGGTPIQVVEWLYLLPGIDGARELYLRAANSAFALLGPDCFGLNDFLDASVRPDYFVRVEMFYPAMYGRLQDALRSGAFLNTLPRYFSPTDGETLAFLLVELLRYRVATEPVRERDGI